MWRGNERFSEVGAPDYYEKKRETVLETIKPICEAFEITDYDYEIVPIGKYFPAEYLVIEGNPLNCTANSIAATVRTLVKFILAGL